ncbi:hypothetical protein [Nocardioides jejuensis]|uniref:Uncharacterized protein n=1 Tax=Nocardioides jejuensis TaxID=2502782 RepID=A0A4R1BWJ6_9ACTN|nr:hypothetical protein [Nocardioides jejuensis]TCJ21655.1 hypothetical protein EPD65_14605 [Nocardioides jejuensis]
MLFLIDSNVAIKADPLGHVLEAGVDVAMEFLRLVSTHHHDLRTHPASRIDFDRISDPKKRAARLALFGRYTPITSPPQVTAAQIAELGEAVPGSNDAVDDALLAAVVGHAVGYLVTEDDGIHRKALRVGVDQRVLRLADAVNLLRTIHVDLPSAPPSVRRVKTHELNIDDPIFDGLKADYPPFVEWFQRAAQSQRDALLIDGASEHAGLVILKKEPTGEHGLPGPQLKLCTFKVADEYSGQKYGELLLKAAFEQAHAEGYKGVFVTLYAKQEVLAGVLRGFGFKPLAGVTTDSGEMVFAKSLVAPNDTTLTPLEQHIAYGPPWIAWDETTPFIVPIEPRWHRVLFPDAEPEEGALFSAADVGTRPFGNALRKAYLCNASTRLLKPGDPLLFYRSHDEKAVFVIGVCESTLVSQDPDEILAEVGNRTVYPLADIKALARRGDVLVVKFRQDRVLRANPITIDELRAAKAVNGWPQQIQRIREEGREWLSIRSDV